MWALMGARRFAPLFWCQFLSAFNDNYVRQMLALLILFRFGGADAGAKIQLAVALFVLPSIPLSPIGGEIADAHDKALIARRIKLAEIFVQGIAAAGVLTGSLALLYVALFGLGVIAALFGPIKYGILPDHLRREELVGGNALVEGATFAAIILGLVVGGYAAARSPTAVALQLGVIALACYLTSRWIPSTRVGAPGATRQPQPLDRDARRFARIARRRPPLGRLRGGQLVLDRGRADAFARAGHRQKPHRRRRRSRDGGQPDFRGGRRGRFARGGASGARTHPTGAGAAVAGRHGGSGNRDGYGAASPARRARGDRPRRVFLVAHGPRAGAGDPALFGGGGDVRRADLRSGAGMVAGRPAGRG